MGAPLPGWIVVDAGALAPSASAVDVLARLQVAAHRLGLETLLRGASAELLDLIAFFELAEVLRVEPRREAEERKQRLGLEEERELGDPPVL
jgi:hypothetical protein